MVKKVLVLLGGTSSEQEVSLWTGAKVSASLVKLGYEVVQCNPQTLLAIVEAVQQHKPYVVFNALHGGMGEGGQVSAVLEGLGVFYTHSAMQACAIAMNKQLTKRLVKEVVQVARGELIQQSSLSDFKPFTYPVVIKPNASGSSVGVVVVRSPEEWVKAVANYKGDGKEVLIEEYIGGREFSVSFFNNKSHVATEIIPNPDRFYDFEEKYSANGAMHKVDPELDKAVKLSLLSATEAVHRTIGAYSVSRSDFIYNSTKGLYFLEINTHPGLTEFSLLPEQAKFMGLSYEGLVELLIQEAFER